MDGQLTQWSETQPLLEDLTMGEELVEVAQEEAREEEELVVVLVVVLLLVVVVVALLVALRVALGCPCLEYPWTPQLGKRLTTKHGATLKISWVS